MNKANAPPPSPAAGSDPAAPTGRTVKILLVEDNRDIARVLASLLKRVGHDVMTVGEIADAERVVAASGPFDLLISDLNLPDGSGLELMRRIGPMPGIAVSGYSTDIDLQECLEAGFVDLLAKPVEFSALQAAIRRIAG